MEFIWIFNGENSRFASGVFMFPTFFNTGLISSGLLQSGFGLLVGGAEKMVEAYGECLTANGVKWSIVKGRDIAGVPPVMLMFDDSYIIADEFFMEKINESQET